MFAVQCGSSGKAPVVCLTTFYSHTSEPINVRWPLWREVRAVVQAEAGAFSFCSFLGLWLTGWERLQEILQDISALICGAQAVWCIAALFILRAAFKKQPFIIPPSSASAADDCDSALMKFIISASTDDRPHWRSTTRLRAVLKAPVGSNASATAVT